MKTKLYLLLFAFGLLFFYACQDDGLRDIRDYYYPVRELTDGLVYEYRDMQYDSLAADYWYYRAIPTDSAYYFTKAYYKSDFIPSSLYREEMVNNGILLRNLYLFESDSTGQQQQAIGNILSANVFPFEVKEDGSELFIYQVRFQLPSQPHGSTTILINRQFQGDTTYVYEGQEHPAILFAINGSVDQRDSIIGDIEPRFTGQEIYAKGLGLVFYARDYGEGAPSFQHQLVDRYPMVELEERARVKWE
jgi:hypothetical protein